MCFWGWFFFTAGHFQGKVKVCARAAEIQVRRVWPFLSFLTGCVQVLYFCLCPVFADIQAADVPALPVCQPAVFGGEPGLRPAGEDVLCRHSHHRAGEGDYQRHAFRPVGHLALCVSLQNSKDVAGQHLPGIQGEKSVPSLCDSGTVIVKHTQLSFTFTLPIIQPVNTHRASLQFCEPPAGDVSVPGDSGGSHRYPPVLLQGLLQPGCPGTVQPKDQLL